MRLEGRWLSNQLHRRLRRASTALAAATLSNVVLLSNGNETEQPDANKHRMAKAEARELTGGIFVKTVIEGRLIAWCSFRD